MEEYKISPRTSRLKRDKIGESNIGRLAEKEVVLNATILLSYFGSSLNRSAKALGICATALKK